MNNKLMEVCRVDVGKKKCDEQSIKQRKEKVKDNDEMYVKERGLTWKRLNKINSSCMDYRFIGYIYSVDIDVKSVKAIQKFYIKCGLPSDVVL
ncbi:19038_t:CDS:2, partial [Dentiscutata erythropus]